VNELSGNFSAHPEPLLRMDKVTVRAEWDLLLVAVENTASFAAAVACSISTAGTIAFYGGLGSGKTTFIQALGAGLGCRGLVTSPTYSIINRYEGGRLPLVHVDCYRVKGEEELYGIGLEEVLAEPAVVCVEWSEKAENLLPVERLEVRLASRGRQGRQAQVRIYGALWPQLESEVNLWRERNV